MVMAENATHHARRSLRLAISAMVNSKLTDLPTVSSTQRLDDFLSAISESPHWVSDHGFVSFSFAAHRGSRFRCFGCSVVVRRSRVDGRDRLYQDLSVIGEDENTLRCINGVQLRGGGLDIRRTDTGNRFVKGDVECQLVGQASAGVLRPARKHGLERLVHRRGVKRIGRIQRYFDRLIPELIDRFPGAAKILCRRRSATCQNGSRK